MTIAIEIRISIANLFDVTGSVPETSDTLFLLHRHSFWLRVCMYRTQLQSWRIARASSEVCTSPLLTVAELWGLIIVFFLLKLRVRKSPLQQLSSSERRPSLSD